MQFKAVLIAAAFAGAAVAESGFLAPREAPDGLYSVYRDVDGSEVHERIDGGHSAKFIRRAAEAEAEAADLTALEARADIPNGVVTCDKDTAPLNAADTDKANSMLDAQCKDWTKVKGGHNFYSISGGVVAFMCNFASQDYGCSTGPRGKYSGQISASCGAYKAGWTTVKEALQGYGGQHYSYGYQKADAKFCGTGK